VTTSSNYSRARSGDPAAILALNTDEICDVFEGEKDFDSVRARFLRWLYPEPEAVEPNIARRISGAPILIDGSNTEGALAWVTVEKNPYNRDVSSVPFQQRAQEVLTELDETLGLGKEQCSARFHYPARVDPERIEGRSHSLPIFLAWLECRLGLCPATDRRDAAGHWIATGDWDDTGKRFKPVPEDGLARKAQLALSRGYNMLLVIEGQGGLANLPCDIEHIELPADLDPLFKKIIEQPALHDRFMSLDSKWLLTIKNRTMQQASEERNRPLFPAVQMMADAGAARLENRVIAASMVSQDATHRGDLPRAMEYWQLARQLKPECQIESPEERDWQDTEWPAEVAILLVDNGMWTAEEWSPIEDEYHEKREKYRKKPNDIRNQFDLMMLANAISSRALFLSRLQSGATARASLADALDLRMLLQDHFPTIFEHVPKRSRSGDSYPLRQRNLLAEVAWTAFKIGDQNIVDRCLETCTRLQILQDELKATVDPNFDRLGDWTVATLEKRHDDADEILEETTLKHTTETVSYLAPHFADRWLVERALAHRQDPEVESTLVKTALELLTFQVEQEKENQVGMEANNFPAEWSLLHELLAMRTRAVLSLYDRDTPPPRWDLDELENQLGDPEKIEAARPLLQLGTRVIGDGDPRGFIHRCPY